MLEVKHLRKEYRTKKGVVTKALDDVSLTFGETGMVFILGKSGSGKSTLLNICGGLDKADSGEIIIKGKSSREFSGPDFDSYRNTYVGFVFQEYNILDEFTVEENIALALELQNKKRDKAVIDRILADVDMTNFASRKPNTLSGGQKQRVAIARALVKEPEIIMADEPTGALDSKTGQQVFDTLKKLSETKLVLVISHDRDFAEQYGDRIIELKDGKVISDQTRSTDEGASRNVKFFGSDTVCISRGAELTDADMQSIKNFLNKSGGSAVISTSRDRITEMKQDLPEMSVGEFEDVKEQPQSKSYPQQKLIRSHLPARHAIRMGASSLKTKPVRLVFTILLSVIAFVLFGLASTLMLFDGRSVTKETLNNSPDGMIILSKAYWQKYKSYEGDRLEYESDEKMTTGFTYDEFKALRDKYPGAIAAISYDARLDDVSMTNVVQQYYTNYVDGVIINDASLRYVNGKAPEADDEVAITDFLLDGLKMGTTKTTVFKSQNDGKNNYTSTEINVKNASDIIYTAENPVFLRISNTYYKVTGVFEGMSTPNDYAELKAAADQDRQFTGDYSTRWMWEETRRNGLYARLAVSESLAHKIGELAVGNDDKFDYGMYFDYSNYSVKIGIPEEHGEIYGEYYNMMSKYKKSNDNKTLDVVDFNGNALTTLPAGSVAVRYNSAASLLYSQLIQARSELEKDCSEAMNQAYSDAYNEYSNTHKGVDSNDYYDEAAHRAAEAEYNVKLNAYAQAAKDKAFNEYSVNNPQPVRKEDQDEYSYNQALSIYNTNRQNYANAAYDYAFNEYQQLNAWPQYYDYVDWTACKAAEEEYDAAREEYAYAAKMNAAGVLKSYFELINDAESKAYAEFNAANPMPEYGTNEYWDWYYRRDSYVRDARDEVDPINALYSIMYEDKVNKTEAAKILKEAYALAVEWNALDKLKIVSDFNGSMESVTISGVYYEGNRWGIGLYMSDELYDKFYTSDGYVSSWHTEYETKYVSPENAYISAVFIAKTNDAVNALVDYTYERGDDDSSAMIMNSVSTQLNMLIDLANSMATGFLIAGLVLALFAFLLMFNFISASISAKKKEIGILRAIGARTADVFKIFLSEAMIIALICFAISAAGAFGLCIFLNAELTANTFVNVSIFVFGPLSLLCVFGIAVLTAVISTVIPVGMYSRKPPVASIRAL